MSNYSTYKGVNTITLDVTERDGTGSMIAPSGTTLERPSATTEGQLRYNTTLGYYEQYTAFGWTGIAAPPIISTVTGEINENTNSTITVNGSNFASGAVVYVVGDAVSGTDRALTTSFINSTQLTAATAAASVNYVGGASYDIKVLNPSGLATTSSAVGAVDRDPTWTTASGTLATIYDSQRGTSGTIATVVATDAESTSVTYAVTTGSLPTGLSLNSSTGVISSNGSVSSVGSDTTTTFSITPTSNGQAGIARSFSIVVKAPVVTSFTTTGSSTWTVPTGLSAIQVMLVGGGGAAGSGSQYSYGGGGAGGMIEMPSFPVTPGGSVSYTVGAGGTGTGGSPGNPGGSSSFGSLTALGGGGGGGQNANGTSGGSGGGGGNDPGPGTTYSGGSGTQPAQPGNSGTYGYGNSGGSGRHVAGQWEAGGGGGGAGGTGGNGYDGRPTGVSANGKGGQGGSGRASTITGSSVVYAGGGAGGGNTGGNVPANGGGGGGGVGSGAGTAGTANTGGGGGGGGYSPSAASGGSGIIIVKY